MHSLTAVKSAFFAFSATLLVTFMTYSGGMGIPNSDNLLRMVTVRDLLGGQSWFDPTQYRLGLDTGTVMHWSRLVDAPIAAIIWTAEAITGDQVLAEGVALIIWPAMTLFIAMFGVLHACRRLERPDMAGPATIIAAVTFLTVGVFGHKALDHHNIQVALGVWLIALLLPGKNAARAHAIAASIAILMIAIGMEALPYVAIAGFWVAFMYLLGLTAPSQARAFGLSLALTSLIVFVTTISPAAYGADYCDAYSSFHIGMCLAGGLGLAATTFIGESIKGRVVGLAASAAIALLLLVTVFSDCLVNPLSKLDPKLLTFWLDGVVETRSLFDLWQSDPFALFGMFGMALFGLIVSLYLGMKKEGSIRTAALLSALMLTAAIAVTAWQQRGMMFAAAFAILPLSIALANARETYRDTQQVSDLLKMVLIGVFSLNMTWWIAGANAASYFSDAPTLQEEIANASPRDYCYGQDVYQLLAQEPKGVVLGATDIGASVLLYTDHRALAGPYHRNTAGNLAMIEAMLAKPDDAEAIVRAAGVTIVADCLRSADAFDFKKASADGLQSMLHKGHMPNWLELIPETVNQPLVLYRVRPDP